MTSAELIALTNDYRIAQGLKPLVVNQRLIDAATYRAMDMAKTQSFSHDVATTSPSMKNWYSFLANKGYDYQSAAENLATTGNSYKTPKDVLTAWSNSPLHNKNLIDPRYTEVGIAVVPGQHQGQPTNYVVQFFGTPKEIKKSSTTIPTVVTKQPTVKEQVKQQTVSQRKTKIPSIYNGISTKVANSTPQHLLKKLTFE